MRRNSSSTSLVPIVTETRICKMPKSFVFYAARKLGYSEVPLYAVAPLPPNHDLPGDVEFWDKEIGPVQEWVDKANKRLLEKSGGGSGKKKVRAS